jgi:branched-subunit amino acid ABC-type transport system permease component
MLNYVLDHSAALPLVVAAPVTILLVPLIAAGFEHVVIPPLFHRRAALFMMLARLAFWVVTENAMRSRLPTLRCAQPFETLTCRAPL